MGFVNIETLKGRCYDEIRITSFCMKKLNIIITGPQASGKGTQAKFLVEKHGFGFYESGKLIRDEISKGTEVGKKFESIINKGNLVPDELINDFFDRKAEPIVKSHERVLFDSFPRNLAQRDHFEKKMEEWGRPDSIFLFIKISREETFKRISIRRECPKCGAKYGDIDEGVEKCKKCGEELKVRDDETKEAVEKRLDEYEKNTKPLIEYYRERGELIEINGEQTREEVLVDIEKALKPYLDDLS